MSVGATTAPTLIAEWHTSHFSQPCGKRVQLTAQGNRIGETASAKYRGLLFHEAVGLFIAAGCDPATAGACASAADVTVQAGATAEHSPMTEVALRDSTDTIAECAKLLEYFAGRFAGILRAGKIIGCELPVRWTVDIDGEPTHFATHLDLLWIDGNGQLRLWDFKTGEASPSWDFLGRSPQLGLMWLMVRHGQVCVDPDLDLWDSFGMFPAVDWVHINALKPYGKATTTKGDDGSEQKFTKGEHRPMTAILRSAAFIEDREAEVFEEIAQRVRQYRAGFFPMVPEEQGCRLCECRIHCPNWAKEERSNG